MGRQGGVRLERVEPNRPGDGPHGEHEHHAENHGRVAVTLEHLAEHHQRRHGQQKDSDAAQEVAEGVGVFERMGAIDAEEPASIGAELLDRDDGRHGTAGNLLDQGRLTVGVGPHRSRIDGGRRRIPVQGHGHAAGDEQHADNEAQRNEDVGRAAPQIDVEVSHVLVAAKPADDRQQGRHADHRRNGLFPADEEQLAEVREVDLAGVVLEIGIRQKRADRVEDRRRSEHFLAVRVQRQIGLQGQDRKADDERQRVEDHERQGVLFPVLRAGVQPRFDPTQPPRRAKTTIEHVCHIQADRAASANTTP